VTDLIFVELGMGDVISAFCHLQLIYSYSCLTYENLVVVHLVGLEFVVGGLDPGLCDAIVMACMGIERVGGVRCER
jgi:hypothetical protein